MSGTGARIALVTGGNRGIGHEVVGKLAEAGLHVLLAARDRRDAEAAARGLAERGSIEPLELDVTDAAEMAAVTEHVRARHGGLDVLVNNAGVLHEGFDARIARETVAVNFFGPLHLTDALLPLLRPGGRVVLVSSQMGDRSILSSPVRERFDAELDREALVGLMRAFVDAAARGTHAREGWSSSAYSVSKIGVTALAGVYARELAARHDPRGIRVNAVCPGWVRTRMGGRSAPRSVDLGAAGVVWAALLPADGPTGGFFRDGAAAPW